MKKVTISDIVIGGTYQCLGGSKDWILKDIKKVCDFSHMHSNRYETTRQYPNGRYKNECSDITEYYEIKTQGENEMTILFQIKGEETYGFKLATNSKGLVVFEVKGTGEVRTVDKDQLIEVFPYTVDVKFLGESRTYSFFSREGDLKVGDMVISPGYSTIMTVSKVDSRNRSATKWITGAVLAAAKELSGE